MGWWERDGLTLGDDPVDLTADALGAFVAGESWGYIAGGARPTWQELLDAAAFAFECECDSGDVFSGATVFTGRRLRARFAPSVPEIVSGRLRDAADEHLDQVLSVLYVKISQSYEREVGRQPTPAEALATLAFVLRRDPGRFVSDGAGTVLVSLEIV